MININIPHHSNLEIKHILLDFNGTIANNGIVFPQLKEKLNEMYLKHQVDIFVLTADTYGTVEEQFLNSNIKIKLVSKHNGTDDKEKIVKELGSKSCIAIGNGFNDSKMLSAAAIGICVIGPEGCSSKTLVASDIVVKSIDDALDIIGNSLKIRATLRP